MRCNIPTITVFQISDFWQITDEIKHWFHRSIFFFKSDFEIGDNVWKKVNHRNVNGNSRVHHVSQDSRSNHVSSDITSFFITNFPESVQVVYGESVLESLVV